MFKRAIFILFVFSLLLAFGCKGQRSVKVKIEDGSLWTATIIDASTSITKSASTTKIYDLGDSKDLITVDAQKQVTCTAQVLTISILEDYDNGFLYQASSTVKETDTTSDSMGTLEIAHDFSDNK
jgi:hypothetical protein